ncbi:discoidin domain-containing protein [Paenibacillaceae bacterium]|nr:discoidin domain-containing protein [Paenibacillaceae bacterium]
MEGEEMRGKRGLIAAAAVLIGICIVVVLLYPQAAAKTVKWAERDGLLIISNKHYEVAFRAEDGAIAYVREQGASLPISKGSREHQLWWAMLGNNTVIASDQAEQFSYKWDKAKKELTLSYSGSLDVDVTAVFDDSNQWTMNAALSNNTDSKVKAFRFPYELLVESDQVQHALLPMLPGIQLTADFFQESNSFEDQYPGVMFASYLALQTEQGSLAMYNRHDETVAVMDLGFKNQIREANTTGIVQHYKVWVEPGQNWHTPTVVIQAGGEYKQSIEDYRNANRLEQYRSLSDKLGDDREQYYAAPFYKLDISAIGRESWSSLTSAWIDSLPQTGVIHLVGFQRGGHDENYPNFIPPDPKWGGEEQFRHFVDYAKSKGNLVIPYTNFSWWGNHSPTLEQLPGGVTLQDIVVKQEDGSMLDEQYGSHSGYVVNPNHPFVRERISQEHQKLLEAGFNGIFEDQWGIRNTPFVFNKELPERADYSNAYIEGMRDYIGNIQHSLYIEDGFDILADDTTGFMGSTLLWNKLGYRPKTAIYSQYYPMIGMLVRDKVMLFQHDLAAETMTSSKEMLRWNMAMGYNLSADLVQGAANPWVNVAGVYQKQLLANYADQRVKDFSWVDDRQSSTVMGDVEVTANWDDQEVLALPDGFVIAGGGVQAVSGDGKLRGGIYTSYNGRELEHGEHYLIEIRDADQIRIYQPMGADTTLAVRKGEKWKHAVAAAYRHDGTLLAELPVEEQDDLILVDYIADMAFEQTGYLVIERSDTRSAVKEVPFAKQVPVHNVALNQDVSTSSETSGEFPGKLAVDGDPYTYWESEAKKFPQFITVDLGQETKIRQAALQLPPIDAWDKREQEIEVLTSTDGSSFKTLLPPTNYTFDPKLENRVEIPLPETNARYVKLVITNNTGWPAAQLSEFEVSE